MDNFQKQSLSLILNDSNSTIESEDEFDLEEYIADMRKKRHQKLNDDLKILSTAPERRKIPKVRCYSETINLYQPDVFKSHFRLSREAVANLTKIIKPDFNALTQNQFGGRENVNLEYRLLMTLWTLANPESFRGISDRFGVAKSTAHRIFLETCSIIAGKEKDYITWPQNYLVMASKFKDLRPHKFPGIIGAVDGVDIPIQCPLEDKASYYNRKGNHSVKMQAICDSECRFTDVFIGFPGSCHDAAIWRSSPIYKKLLDGKQKEFHLLGDSAYPLDIFLMNPYRDNGHLSQQQMSFNYILSSYRVIIENAYGLLKGKYRRLKYLHMFKMEELPKVIMPCCVLHNFGLEETEPSELLDDDEKDDFTLSSGMEDNETNSEAETKRNYLCSLLVN